MNSWEEIKTLFGTLGDRERLEWMVSFGDDLPGLNEHHRRARDAGLNMVHGCMTPVYLSVEVQHDRLDIQADVPKESAVVRGFVAILKAAFHGASCGDFVKLNPDPLSDLGLKPLLGTRRRKGLQEIVITLDRSVRQAT